MVTSSGQLLRSRQGAQIDQTECVIRMNDAPTRTEEGPTLVALMVKNLPVMRRTWVQSLGWKDLASLVA